MDYKAVPAPQFGRSLGAMQDTLLARDVLAEVVFPIGVIDMQADRASSSFATVLHADQAFGAHPFLSWLPSDAPLRRQYRLAAARITPPTSLLQDLPVP